jgi:hypothetical protein
VSAVWLWLSSSLSAFGAMAALCTQTPAVRARIGWREQTPWQRTPSVAAALMLTTISLAAAWQAGNASFAWVAWLCQLGVLGLGLIVVFPFAPRAVARAGVLCALASTVVLLVTAG